MNLQEYLEKQLDRIDKWLSFAEAKNAALIAFNVALLAFVTELLSGYPYVNLIFIMCILVATVVALISFYPFKGHPNNKKEKYTETSEIDKINLTFWAEIAKFEDHEKYLGAVTEKYFSGQNEYSSMAKDLAAEVWENSGIAARKYKLFRYALTIELVSIVVTLLLFLIA